jgi:hypothetical protein
MTHLPANLRISRAVRTVVLPVLTVLTLSAPDALAQGNNARAFSVVPITITNVVVENGALVANGLIGTTPFRLPLSLTPGATPAGAECPILDLALGPINLSLLGLNVDTSPICLEITATPGGGLLGDLLCGIANLLNQGVPLAQILGALNSGQLARLTNGLTQVLNSVFDTVTSSHALVGASCDILNLAVGPLDLSLLGLNVRLDDCSNGPVTVDITATPGAGLLGDLLAGLLCDLGQVFNQNPFNAVVQRLLTQIAAIIGALLS